MPAGVQGLRVSSWLGRAAVYLKPPYTGLDKQTQIISSIVPAGRLGCGSVGVAWICKVRSAGVGARCGTDLGEQTQATLGCQTSSAAPLRTCVVALPDAHPLAMHPPTPPTCRYEAVHADVPLLAQPEGAVLGLCGSRQGIREGWLALNCGPA